MTEHVARAPDAQQEQPAVHMLSASAPTAPDRRLTEEINANDTEIDRPGASDEILGEADEPGQGGDTPKLQDTLSWRLIIICTIGVFVCLYIFLIGLDLMGTAFKVIGGRNSAGLFAAVDNPIAGVMTGILATVLVQSSSTSTSIVVAMVGADQLSVRSGIPIIMGANIGTSVTNTIVSMGQSGNRIELERAFAGATVHDMFNLLSVVTLLPIEAVVAAINGQGGPLYWFTYELTDVLVQGKGTSELFESPIKTITSPIKNAIVKANKYVILALTLNKPVAQESTATNAALCEPLGDMCKTHYCISKDLDKLFKKINKKAHKKFHSCKDHVFDEDGSTPCGPEKCYLDAGAFYDKYVEHGRLVKGGFLKGLNDVAAGVVALVISLIMLSGGLIGLCKMLQMVFLGKAKRIIRCSVHLNDYLAMLIGTGLTIIVQSSSVVTSALTPICGLGVLPLEKMFPMTLGANIGTTCTALLAACVSLKFGAVQIALCHLFFNIIGILIWFPVKPMRRVPLYAASLLGLYASYYRGVPGVYILIVFVIIPLVCLGVSALFNANVVAGMVVLVFVLCCFGAFELWWLRGCLGGQPGAYLVLSKAAREKGEAELAAANAKLRGEHLEDSEIAHV